MQPMFPRNRKADGQARQGCAATIVDSFLGWLEDLVQDSPTAITHLRQPAYHSEGSASIREAIRAASLAPTLRLGAVGEGGVGEDGVMVRGLSIWWAKGGSHALS